MSLSTTPPAPSLALGLLAAKDFDSPQVLEDILTPKLATIRHVYTNGANSVVLDFCRANGLSHTVYPVHGGRGLPASTRDVVEASDFVLIIATPGSKSAGQIEKACRERAAKDAAFKWRTEAYNPSEHWRAKVYKVCEILSCMSKADLEANAWAQSIWKEVSA